MSVLVFSHLFSRGYCCAMNFGTLRAYNFLSFGATRKNLTVLNSLSQGLFIPVLKFLKFSVAIFAARGGQLAVTFLILEIERCGKKAKKFRKIGGIIPCKLFSRFSGALGAPGQLRVIFLKNFNLV